MKAKNLVKFIGCIILCELLGNIGSLATFPAITGWYASLNKPFFNPPNWLFGPVWTTLFLLMGISLYLVLERKNQKGAKIAQVVFAVQFALNILWSFLFFGLKSPLLGFVEIIFLWLSISATIFYFSKVSKKAALLLVPYILWVSIATALNYSVMVLNP